MKKKKKKREMTREEGEGGLRIPFFNGRKPLLLWKKPTMDTGRNAFRRAKYQRENEKEI